MYAFSGDLELAYPAPMNVPLAEKTSPIRAPTIPDVELQPAPNLPADTGREPAPNLPADIERDSIWFGPVSTSVPFPARVIPQYQLPTVIPQYQLPPVIPQYQLPTGQPRQIPVLTQADDADSGSRDSNRKKWLLYGGVGLFVGGAVWYLLRRSR